MLGIVGVAWEWPLPLLAGTGLHRSIEARLIMYPLSALCALLIYQGTNSGLYYIIGMMAYFWAYSEGEVRLLYHSIPKHFLTCIIDRLPRTMDTPQARRLSTKERCMNNFALPQYKTNFLLLQSTKSYSSYPTQRITVRCPCRRSIHTTTSNLAPIHLSMESSQIGIPSMSLLCYFACKQ